MNAIEKFQNKKSSMSLISALQSVENDEHFVGKIESYDTAKETVNESLPSPKLSKEILIVVVREGCPAD